MDQGEFDGREELEIPTPVWDSSSPWCSLAARVRAYFNRFGDMRHVWSIDFGNTETEFTCAGIQLNAVSAKAVAVETVEDPTKEPRAWVEFEGVWVEYDGAGVITIGRERKGKDDA